MANDQNFIPQALIAEGKIVKLADIDPNTSYAQIGIWQDNQRQAASAGNAYPSYVIKLSELTGGGGGCPPITQFVIPSGTGPCINNGTWAFGDSSSGGLGFGPDIYPLKPCSNIGLPSNRIKTIFMCSEIDYTNDLYFKSAGRFNLTMSTDGRFYGNAITSTVPSNAGFQYNSEVGNRANFRANAWSADANGAGSTYFHSRSGVIGTRQSLVEGDIIGHQTYIGVSADNSSINLAAIVDVRVSTGGVFPAYVATDWNLALMDKAGIRSDKVRVTSEGFMGINTSAPAQTLHVVAPVGGYGIRTSTGANYVDIVPQGSNFVEFLTNRNGYELISDSGRLRLNRSGATGDALIYGLNLDAITFGDNTGTPIMTAYYANNSVGIGTVAPTARLHLIGASSTNADFALKVHNSTTSVFEVRNDGIVGVGGVNAFTNYKFHIQTSVANDGLQVIGGGVGTLTLGADTDTQSGVLRLRDQPAGTDGWVLRTIGDSYTVGLYNFGVGVAPTAKLHVRSNGSTTGYAFKVESTTPSMLFNVRDDGRINMGSLPLVPAGLVAGDLWNNAGVVNIV